MSSKPLLQMAKALTRASLPVQRRGNTPQTGSPSTSAQPSLSPTQPSARPVIQVVNMPAPTPDAQVKPEPMYGKVLDSWGPEYQELTEPKKIKRGRGRPRKDPELQNENKPAAPKMKTPKHKRRLRDEDDLLMRTRSMCFSVNAHERKAIMDHVDTLKSGESVSCWIRNTLFRAMGERPPSRPKTHR